MDNSRFININKRIKNIKEEIDNLHRKIDEKRTEEYLLSYHFKGPSIVYCTKLLGKYEFLTTNLYLPQVNLKIYPIWLTFDCVYPNWSTDLRSIVVRDLKIDRNRDLEIIMNGIQKSTKLNHSQIKKLIDCYTIIVPKFSNYSYNSNNLIIDYSKGEKVDADYLYHFNIDNFNQDELLYNTVMIKYFLIIPIKI